MSVGKDLTRAVFVFLGILGCRSSWVSDPPVRSVESRDRFVFVSPKVKFQPNGRSHIHEKANTRGPLCKCPAARLRSVDANRPGQPVSCHGAKFLSQSRERACLS